MPRSPSNLVPVLISTSGLDRLEATRQLQYLAQRHKKSDAAYQVVSWVLAMSIAYTIIRIYWDQTKSLGPAWDLWSGLGTCILMAPFVILLIQLIYRRQHRRLLRYMQAPLCFRCGYSLQDLTLEQPETLVIRCPECGNASPCSAEAARLAAAAAPSAPILTP